MSLLFNSVMFLIDVFDGLPKMMSVVLGALTVFLIMAVIYLAAKIKHLQKGIFVSTDFHIYCCHITEPFFFLLKKNPSIALVRNIATKITIQFNSVLCSTSHWRTESTGRGDVFHVVSFLDYNVFFFLTHLVMRLTVLLFTEPELRPGLCC